MNWLKIIHQRKQPNLVRANIILLTLIALILVVVSFSPERYQDSLNKILITAIYFVAVYALANRRLILLPIAFTLTIVQWVSKFLNNDILTMIMGVLNMIFFTYVVIRLITQFVAAKKVSSVVILGSINGYLLMGLMLSLFAMIISGIYAQSYYSSAIDGYLDLHTNLHTFLYYTFITMATVGYGDIVPITAAARALAVLVAVAGQLYIAVVIAFLVGKFVGQAMEKRGKD